MMNVHDTAPKLRIAIIGVGGIGSTFAFQLARTGQHEVTVVARPRSVRFQQLQHEQAIVKANGERADIRVASTLNEATAYDLVLVTLQSQQVESILPMLQRSVAKSIQFMCNLFDPEQVQAAVGVERCSFGMPFVQGSIDPAGRLNAKIGAGGQKSKMNNQKWVSVFNAAGLPAVLEPDMLLWLRCHVPVCIAFQSVSLAGMRRGGGASWGESLTLSRGMNESFRLIERLGYNLYPSGKALLHASPAFVAASMLWFMSRIRPFRELLATGANECRALVDVVMASAQRADPPVSIAKILAMKPLDPLDATK